MAQVTIRPTSILAQDGAGTPGSTLTWVSDNSDATYQAFTNGGSIVAALANPSLPAGAQVRQVRAFARLQTQTGAAAYAVVYLYGSYPDGNWQSQQYTVSGGTPFSFANPWMAANTQGQPWTIADVNNLAIGVVLDVGVRVYDLWVLVDYNLPPTAAVLQPSGSWTANTQPTVTWTYTDAEANIQDRFQVKVFSAAQYGAGGFDPTTSGAVWDSGQVASAATGVRVTANLQNGASYRAYVRVGDAGSNGRWSAWVYSSFTIAVPVPSQPTLTVSTSSSSNVGLTVGNLSATNGVVIERSEDGGVTWVPLRGAYGWTAPGSTFTTTDYEAAVNTTLQYRAYAYTVDTIKNVFSSAYSTVQTAYAPNSKFRLKDPFVPGLELVIGLQSWRVTSPRKEGKFQPLGSRRAVVVTDSTPGGTEIPLPLYFKNDADYRTFMAMRDSGHVLRLVTDTADQWWVALTEDADIETAASPTRSIAPYRTLSVTAVEVDRPVDTTPAPGS